MAKQPTIVERYCAVFVNGEKPGPTGSFRRKVHPPLATGATDGATSSTGLRQSHLADDGVLETTLTNDMPIGEPLTMREIQIMKSIVAGRTNKQMARTLCRSPRTIEYHRNRLMRKLNAHNSAELVRRAIAMGIV